MTPADIQARIERELMPGWRVAGIERYRGNDEDTKPWSVRLEYEQPSKESEPEPDPSPPDSSPSGMWVTRTVTATFRDAEVTVYGSGATLSVAVVDAIEGAREIG
jgi:hypothetical protein